MKKTPAMLSDIDNALNRNGFEIHDIMFNIKDLIQSALYCNNSLYHALTEHSTCNGLMVSVSYDRWMSISPISYSKKFTECLSRNSTDPTTMENAKNRNAYIEHDENTIVLLLTKGFILDNFEIQESYHDFLMDENKNHIVMEPSDFESLTDKNPKLI